MLKLTIIIPHYNSTDSLCRLLKTIPDSSEIQIVVIDDHSDESHKMELSKLEENISHENIDFLNNVSDKKGAGACRNIGLTYATGKWILFADSDDYFIDGFYDIIQKHFQSNSDVVFFKPTSIELDTGKVSSRHLPFVELIDGVLDGHDSQKKELFLRYNFVVPWSKLIKNSFLEEHNIFFDEVISANDVAFSTKVGYYMNEFDLSDEVIYCVTKNKGSLTMTMNQEVFDTRLSVFIDQHRFLKERLSKKDFKTLGLSGRPLLIKSIDIGISKMLAVFLKLKKHKVRIIDPKLFNPLWFIKKTLFVYGKHKNEKRYYKKE